MVKKLKATIPLFLNNLMQLSLPLYVPQTFIHSHFITAREQVKIEKLALDLGMIRLELMTQNIIPMRQNVQLGTTNAKQVFYCDTSTQALVHTLTDMHQITHSPTCKMLTQSHTSKSKLSCSKFDIQALITIQFITLCTIRE